VVLLLATRVIKALAQEGVMIKLPIILATVIAAVPCYAQDVRVFSGGEEHVYGPGGQLVRQSGPSGKERAGSPELTRHAAPQGLSIQRSGPSQVPKSWWNNNGYEPPKSAWSQ
jgi:hypothetical protein